MSFSRKPILASIIAIQCLVAALAGAPARADTIPDYFFTEWTVSKNCTEQHAGLAARVQTGLKFKISRDSQAADGSFVFEAQDSGQKQWGANWNGMKLQFRPGTDMKTLPADFECIPGQEATSPFLAMSNYAQATEPYYEQAHWYGIAKTARSARTRPDFPAQRGHRPTRGHRAPVRYLPGLRATRRQRRLAHGLEG